eukprot:3684124-Rhodomonas_salina.3
MINTPRTLSVAGQTRDSCGLAQTVALQARQKSRSRPGSCVANENGGGAFKDADAPPLSRAQTHRRIQGRRRTPADPERRRPAWRARLRHQTEAERTQASDRGRAWSERVCV